MANYKWYIDLGGGEQLFYPIYDGEIVFDLEKESNYIFKRLKLTSSIWFSNKGKSGNLYSDILNKPFNFRYNVRVTKNGSEFWTGFFHQTDCEIDEDNKTIKVDKFTTIDQYTTFLENINKEYDIYKLYKDFGISEQTYGRQFRDNYEIARSGYKLINSEFVNCFAITDNEQTAEDLGSALSPWKNMGTVFNGSKVVNIWCTQRYTSDFDDADTFITGGSYYYRQPGFSMAINNEEIFRQAKPITGRSLLGTLSSRSLTLIINGDAAYTKRSDSVRIGELVVDDYGQMWVRIGSFQTNGIFDVYVKHEISGLNQYVHPTYIDYTKYLYGLTKFSETSTYAIRNNDFLTLLSLLIGKTQGLATSANIISDILTNENYPSYFGTGVNNYSGLKYSRLNQLSFAIGGFNVIERLNLKLSDVLDDICTIINGAWYIKEDGTFIIENIDYFKTYGNENILIDISGTENSNRSNKYTFDFITPVINFTSENDFQERWKFNTINYNIGFDNNDETENKIDSSTDIDGCFVNNVNKSSSDLLLINTKGQEYLSWQSIIETFYTRSAYRNIFKITNDINDEIEVNANSYGLMRNQIDIDVSTDIDVDFKKYIKTDLGNGMIDKCSIDVINNSISVNLKYTPK